MEAAYGSGWQGCDEAKASLGSSGGFLGCLGDRAEGREINKLGATGDTEISVWSWTDTRN